ncbi:MAG: hypothetical protein QOI41_1432, partial [Myxococcales bacterium]|nr:hypothetical protein [Myxococcales bacterium]
TMEELEKRYLLRVFKLVGNNKSRAAEVLGIDRRTMYRKLERYAALDGTDAPAADAEHAAPAAPAADAAAADAGVDDVSGAAIPS